MNGLDTLTTPECWALLAAHDVGRVAYTENAMPTIVPIRYAVVGTHLVLRCRSERVATTLDGQVVALEVDDVDHDGSGNRSVVVVTGPATQVLAGHEHDDQPHCPAGCAHRTAIRLEASRVVGQQVHDVA